MRDFIQTWEKQNNVSLDSKNITDDQRRAVTLEAVDHANKALFDYSQVPPAVDFARRYPLGAPFITFMYKSFPIVIESMAKRPLKFAKYAAFPALMTTLAQAMNDWSDEDMEALEASLPEWSKDKSSTFIYPIKDKLGRPQFAEYGYALPWSPFVDAGLKLKNHFDSNGLQDSMFSSLVGGQQAADDFGFLGGPLPQLITAWQSNRDNFTGQPIINAGDNPDAKFASMSTWLWNMAAPSFISSHGFLGQLYDKMDTELPPFGIPEPLDKFGKEKRSSGQILGNLTGFAPRGFDPQDSAQNTLKNFARKLNEISKSQSKFLKDKNVKRNPEERASGLRQFNTRRKLIIQERKEFVKSIKNLRGLDG